ncbi:tRNA (guanine(26)-N(2))-dimethyltransferase [Momordica charantia]|uniref:tRNA (guanine(26)-N(2))-dimethyltransferase n=1 Tax=Momordica charantia TaxID=3673 RepID=A0A6J1CZK5_MOMCH|nr:tRNA (guanine(26)-N(2))-dimethyltransferase [Momordica charantia]
MLTAATSKTLSSSSFLHNPQTNSHSLASTTIHLFKFPQSQKKSHTNCLSNNHTERGIEFDIGDTFFRHESATGRDLGVLAASLYRRSKHNLRVLDALCGCGIRSLRYLVEAEADFVWANDANDENRRVILNNLSQVTKEFGDNRRWLATNFDANRVMTEIYLQKDFFDFIDVDSFGSDSTFLRSAINALKVDGLLYVTSTDGYSSGGHRPSQSLAAYGAYVRPMPFSNEIGLRMLIGGVVREASVLGYYATPLFSYYSYHGPVFRVLLRINRGKIMDHRHYGFISYCKKCGNSQVFSWTELGLMSCPCNDSRVSESLVVSGPLWTGPLHSADYIEDMLTLAKQWGWIGNGQGMDLEKLLQQMVDESDSKLPVGFIKLDEVASRAKVNSPPLKVMMNEMIKAGYAASRSHIASNAIKTNCPMAECIRIALELQHSCLGVH